MREITYSHCSNQLQTKDMDIQISQIYISLMLPPSNQGYGHLDIFDLYTCLIPNIQTTFRKRILTLSLVSQIFTILEHNIMQPSSTKDIDIQISLIQISLIPYIPPITQEMDIQISGTVYNYKQILNFTVCKKCSQVCNLYDYNLLLHRTKSFSEGFHPSQFTSFV